MMVPLCQVWDQHLGAEPWEAWKISADGAASASTAGQDSRTVHLPVAYGTLNLKVPKVKPRIVNSDYYKPL